MPPRRNTRTNTPTSAYQNTLSTMCRSHTRSLPTPNPGYPTQAICNLFPKLKGARINCRRPWNALVACNDKDRVRGGGKKISKLSPYWLLSSSRLIPGAHLPRRVTSCQSHVTSLNLQTDYTRNLEFCCTKTAGATRNGSAPGPGPDGLIPRGRVPFIEPNRIPLHTLRNPTQSSPHCTIELRDPNHFFKMNATKN